MLVDFGCCSKASNVVAVGFATAIEEGKGLVAKNSFVVFGEFVEFGFQFFYFFFVVVGDVFVDMMVAEVLVNALFDVDIS